ncbi:MAG: hypothetical protein ISS16_08315 [Ignavibacteria bacterium]|nr:hypothetical protein [Ignavibacteria bacterium]
MKYNKSKKYFYIILSCIFTYLIFELSVYYFTNGKFGVPLDDSWIHFRFAENFANGYFFHYNIGEPAAGSTSPFWVVLLAGFSFISGNFIFISIFLSAVFHLLSVIFIYKISLEVFKDLEFSAKKLYEHTLEPEFLSLIVALLTVLAGRFAWAGLSGMETTMFAFFCLIGIYVHIRNLQNKKFTIIPALLFGLATVSRPEGFLLSVLYFFDVLLNLWKEKTFKKNLFKVFISLIIFLCITTPYLIFSYNTSSHFFPNTFNAQGGNFEFIPNFNYLRIIMIFFFRDNLVVALLYLVTIIFYIINLKKYFTKFRYLNLIYLWIVCLPLVSSFLVPNWRHHGRYLMPLIPLLNLAAIYILINIFYKIKKDRLRQLLTKNKVYVSLILIASLMYYGIFAIAIGKNTDNINDQQVRIAYWIKANVPPDETIAINDIGAITYLTKNRIIDMAGLVTPEVLTYRTYRWEDNLDSLFYLLKKNNVSYIVVYDHWYEDFLERFSEHFQKVFSAYLQENTICGGFEMNVYRTKFSYEE